MSQPPQPPAQPPPGEFPAFADPAPGGFRIRIKAVPGARRDQVAGPLGDRLKVRVAAPPEGGKANLAIARVLSEALGIHARDVELIAGPANPEKVFFVRGITPGDLARLIR